MDAAGLVAGLADLAGVVGGEERTDHELARLDVRDLGAHLFDDADVFLAHRRGPVDGLDAAVGPAVRPAHARRGELDDGVGRLLDARVGPGVETDVTGSVQAWSSHEGSPWIGSCSG
jgi:hypothetical protein